MGFSDTTTLDRVLLNRLLGSTAFISDQRQFVLDCMIQGPQTFPQTCVHHHQTAVSHLQDSTCCLCLGIPSVAGYVTVQWPTAKFTLYLGFKP